jgi:hypothetical protein
MRMKQGMMLRKRDHPVDTHPAPMWAFASVVTAGTLGNSLSLPPSSAYMKCIRESGNRKGGLVEAEFRIRIQTG